MSWQLTRARRSLSRLGGLGGRRWRGDDTGANYPGRATGAPNPEAYARSSIAPVELAGGRSGSSCCRAGETLPANGTPGSRHTALALLCWFGNVEDTYRLPNKPQPKPVALALPGETWAEPLRPTGASTIWTLLTWGQSAGLFPLRPSRGKAEPPSYATVAAPLSSEAVNDRCCRASRAWSQVFSCPVTTRTCEQRAGRSPSHFGTRQSAGKQSLVGIRNDASSAGRFRHNGEETSPAVQSPPNEATIETLTLLDCPLFLPCNHA